MSVSQKRKTPRILDQHGFTLVEVLTTIVIMGIVLAIASSSWQGVTASRALTSATNQVVADLRKSHSTASNRLVSQEVKFTTGQASYGIRPEGGTYKTVSLPNEGPGTQIGTTITLFFKSDGSACIDSSPCISGGATNTTIRVRLANDPTKFNDIEFNASTSRVKIAP